MTNRTLGIGKGRPRQTSDRIRRRAQVMALRTWGREWSTMDSQTGERDAVTTDEPGNGAAELPQTRPQVVDHNGSEPDGSLDSKTNEIRSTVG
ncbi:hypothetical protein LA080_011047 [Diaporthe eres]|nr:hypothetical protein LA080_011047 [Diaporthe eres]